MTVSEEHLKSAACVSLTLDSNGGQQRSFSGPGCGEPAAGGGRRCAGLLGVHGFGVGWHCGTRGVGRARSSGCTALSKRWKKRGLGWLWSCREKLKPLQPTSCTETTETKEKSSVLQLLNSTFEEKVSAACLTCLSPGLCLCVWEEQSHTVDGQLSDDPGSQMKLPLRKHKQTSISEHFSGL